MCPLGSLLLIESGYLADLTNRPNLGNPHFTMPFPRPVRGNYPMQLWRVNIGNEESLKGARSNYLCFCIAPP